MLYPPTCNTHAQLLEKFSWNADLYFLSEKNEESRYLDEANKNTPVRWNRGVTRLLPTIFIG